MKIKLRLVLCFVAFLGVIQLTAQNQFQPCPKFVENLKAKASELEQKGEWSESIEKYQQALRKAKESRSHYCEAGVSRSLARVYSIIGNAYKSVDFEDSLFQELTGFIKIEDFYREARLQYDNALNASAEAGDLLGTYYARYGIITTKQNLGQYDAAVSDYNEIIFELKAHIRSPLSGESKADYSSLLSWMISARALIIFDQSKFKLDVVSLRSVVEDYNLAEELMLSSGNRNGLAEVYQNKGLAFSQLDISDSALFYSRKGLKEAEEAGNSFLISKSWYHLAKVFAKLNRLDSAYHYLSLYDQSHDRLMGTKQQEAISNTIGLLRLERQNSELEQLRLMIIIAGILVVLLAVTVVYSIQRRRVLKRVSDQKINDLLQQQEIRSLQGVLAGQETERNRIAADLHDKLGAILGMVKLHFSAVEERIDSLKEDNKQQYEKANALLDQASEEVRNISHNLISGVLTKFGLVPALQDLKDTIESTGKLKVNLSLAELEARLDGERELQIYRIIQELLSNILKHAQATEADIQLTRHNGNLNLMVQDNGVGFDPEAARSKKGIGMQNLQARVEQLNGSLHYDSGKGAGTTVTIDIPL